MKAVNLKCEYLRNPLGIDIVEPQLFWNCEGGVKQTAYCIIATDEENNVLWNTGKVISSQMTHIKWSGAELKSRTRVNWGVTLWDENDNEGEPSEVAFFEMGLLNPSDWKAKWITGNYIVNRRKQYPVDCFKREFKLNGKIKHARLYMTACGIYSVCVNGNEIAMPLAPGITNYKKRIQYQTYDVTKLLEEKNTVTAELADGWYRGSCGAWGLRNQYGTKTKIFAQLEIVYEDGMVQTIVTDENWQWSNDGAITFADNKDGEILDVSKKPTYSQKAKITNHKVIPVCSNNSPIAECETFKGEMTVTPTGKKLIDFKQNMAGYVSFAISAKAGQKIVLRFGEMLENGELTQKNIQCTSKIKTTPLQKIEFTCKEGVNEYKTKFAIFGFRYMEISTEIDVKADDFTAIAVYSQMEETGFFDSSNELLNRFVKATKWSTKSNSTDLPTDCPTRERHGWSGDAQIFFNTASYLFDYATFGKKYQKDLCDEQRRNGNFSQIAPYGGVDFYMTVMNGSPGWSDAGVLIPYRLYKKYNDKRVLEENYDAMYRFARYKIKTIGKWYPTARLTGVGLKYSRYISNYGQSYGEWAEPTDVKAFSVGDFISPHPEETTAYIVYMLECMADVARILNKTQDEKRFTKYAVKVRLGYQKLVSTKKHSLDTDRQAKLVRPLYMNLLTENQKLYAEKRLIEAIENYGWRLGTGFLSTPLILDVLADIDIEYAYKLLENEEMPGWLFMSKMGATTIWESWEGTKAQGGIASLNHYSKGAVCEWLFKTMCGIKVKGENHFEIAPKPGGKFTYANAEYKSIFGRVKSGWNISEGKGVYEIEIPANTSADIILPCGLKKTVSAGKYIFE